MDSFREKIRKFEEREKELQAYRAALTIMGVDERNGAPVQGADYRTEMRAVLSAEYQKKLTDEVFYDLVCELYENREKLPEEVYARKAELYYEKLSRERSVPPEEYAAFEKILAASIRAWPKAREESDFGSFAPYLKEVIKGYCHLTELQGECTGAAGSIFNEENAGISCAKDSANRKSLYDRMLASHQPGWDTARYDAFFDAIREKIPAILEKKLRTQPPQGNFMHAFCPVDGQRKVMEKILTYIGFTKDWGKISESIHPLTSPICAGDVRFSTRYLEHDAVQAVLSTIHESGHARHAHGIDPAFDGTILSRCSAGLCESQSRLCENHLGRSKAFWEANFHYFQEAFPEAFGRVSAEEFWQSLHFVQPSPIRTMADEVTYPLHILIRYELEKEFIKGSLSVKDLEEAWNEKYRRYLGITPRNAAEGVLQDMHWPYAYFGYFPTYALGSAFAAQFYHTMERAVDVPVLLKENRYGELMGWLAENIHRYGNLYEADELLLRVTGEQFNADYYFDWLEL